MVQLTKVLTTAALAACGLATIASAHPGAHHQPSTAELAQRKLFMTNSKRALEGCANSEAARQLKERSVARRAAKVDELRKQRRRLDTATILATDHESSLSGITTDVDPSTLFGTEVTCILEPEVEQGPYYVNGEYIRNDIREDQEGVALYTEFQVIDVNTCLPVEDLYLEIFNCNATGVYSGVVASGNGDSSDLSNINATFLRGLWPTDSEGIVSYSTLFPGHYDGRATHIHVLASYNGTVLENNTYAGSVAASVSQIFFDQDLITQVEALEPYSTNTIDITTNEVDRVFNAATLTDFDPVMEYVLLGDTVEDGIFAWINIGIDMTVAHTVVGASTLTANGGVSNSANGGVNAGSSNGMGGGSGFNGGSGQGGIPPSGSVGGEGDIACAARK